MKPKWRKLTVVLAPLAAIASVMYGCSTSRPEASGNGNVTVDPGSTDTCSTEGQERPCYELVSVQSGVRSCFQGKQTCRGGLWSTCGGSGTIEATNIGVGVPNLADLTPGEVKALNHVANGAGDAAACSNKCNPDCRGYDEDAGITLEGSVLPDAVVGLNATPPGFVNKLLRDKANAWGSDCERWDTGNNATGWVHSACQSDYYCARHTSGPTEGNCVQFAEGAGETHAGKLGLPNSGGVECADAFPDLTLGTPCELAGNVIVPICNRGAAAVAAGTVVRVSEENSSLTTPTAPTLKASPDAAAPMAACPTHSSNICAVTLPQALNPGDCIRFSGAICAGALNGNKSLYVNADKSIRECIIQPRVLGPPVSAHGPASEQAQQYGCANNYTAFNVSQIPACIVAYEPVTVVVPYSPRCSTGEKLQWGKLAWNASLPTTTNILFEVRVRERFEDGGLGPFGAWVTVGNAKQLPLPALDPAICSMSGPTPCPKDLYAPLGGIPAARYEDLELRITLNPSINGQQAPTLNYYNLAYTCVGAE